ncbi:MAG: reverse transcriptase domain-containing protein, partial [Candidatus Thiodiazotropha endolucinida]|nr:retroviral-like aspartic protease family protein [Candidatus Thiodiazotropha taylori]MCW4346760.1 reverse transcriptase domain-containing protein [Candidatus Thiodiazotropha endolucinida]
MKVKPATFDGTGSWLDYKAHFDAVAEINGWNQIEKGLYLAVSLRGQAQGVFGNISTNSKDYDKLVLALEERFAPPNQTELYRVQLRERRQSASETLSAMGQEIRRLTNLAYPTAPYDVRETLAKEQFIDALHSSDMRLRVKQARPKDLNDAVRHAVELEAYNRAERRKTEGQGYRCSTSTADTRGESSSDNMEKLTSTLKLIQEDLKTLKSQTPGYRSFRTPGQPRDTRGYGPQYQQRPFSKPQSPSRRRRPLRECYQCGSTEHLIRDCDQNPRKTEGQKNTEDQPKVSEKDSNKSVKVSGTNNSGLFAAAEVNGKPVYCLVDTGATLTIISTKVWELVDPPFSALTPFPQTISTATGSPIEVSGKARVQIKMAKSICYIDVIVANIENDLIIGLDFLKNMDCRIDVAQGTLTIQGETMQLDCLGYVGCSRIVASEMVQIPPLSERIISGKMVESSLSKDRLCIIEPSESFLQKGKALIARTLTFSQDKVPIRVMNMTDEICDIYPGTNLAKASSVSEVQKVKPISSRNRKTVPDHLTDLYDRTVEGMNGEQKNQISKLLNKYSSVFSENDDDIGRTGVLKHKIPTADALPIKQPLRRVPYHMQKEMDDQIENMLKKDVITPSKSPWASGIVLVKKKDGSKRFCVDYRRLNDVTIKDAYPLPRIDESLDQLAGSKWFSCLDMNAGYWQVELDPEDRKKTAFISRKGLFEFKVLPFGLCNAPASFERLIEIVLAGLHWETCLVYLDDIIVCGKTFEDMVKNLGEVFERLQEAGLKLKARKCQLFAKKVDFLGHIISEEGISTDPSKTECIRNWPVPQNVKEVRSFLGLCSYYRRFIYRFSEIAKPLTKLTEKYRKFKFTQECLAAFQDLKSKLIKAPVLA